MSMNSLLALFGAMCLLAIVPGPAVFAVFARAFSSGLSHGIYMTAGIVLGDYVFIVIALFGLSVLAEIMGPTFLFIKYFGAAYLVWLGYKLLRAKASSIDLAAAKDCSRVSSFSTGLLITLGNPKAILFYVGIFPAFINVGDVTFYDTASIMLAATLAFGGVNIGYSLLAVKARDSFRSPNASTVINRVAGTIMVSTGVLFAIRA